MIYRNATISACGLFRYTLQRTWDPGVPPLVFVMLNPSKADASFDDPTIRKCIGFAQRLGFGGIVVVNLYAYRATNPATLHDLIEFNGGVWAAGEDNDLALLRAVQGNTVVCAWGANARGYEQTQRVLMLVRKQAARTCALRLLSDGAPQHPLMLPYSCELIDL